LCSDKDANSNQKILSLVDTLCLSLIKEKNRVLLLHLSEKLNIDIKELEKLSNDQICSRLQKNNSFRNSIFSPYLYIINKLKDLIHYILYDLKRPATFIKYCQIFLENLLVNEIVYKSLFNQKLSALLQENAYYLIRTNGLIDTIYQIQFEIGIVIEENVSSFVKDLSKSSQRVKSVIFFGKLNDDQLLKLQSFYVFLTHIHKQILLFKKILEKVPNIEDELNRIKMIEREDQRIEREKQLLELKEQELRIKKVKLSPSKINLQSENIYNMVFRY